MDYGNAAERLMGMNDTVWARHANPLSVWTRLLAGPVWFWAVWSYVWIGWGALAPVALLSVWTWINPRIFPRPRTLNAWGTKGVLGERVWLSRKTAPIPRGFARAANITSTFAAVGVALAAFGFVARDFWAAFIGWHFAIISKVWFVDRMVWLWDVTPDKDARLADWGLSSKTGA